jgi:phosphatidylethanolamine-binding protein
MPAGVQRGFARSVIDSDEKPVRKGLGVDLGDGKGRCLMAGEWNSAVYGPLGDMVRPEDAQCAKNRMSGMWNPSQPLWEHLASSGSRTLLFTGVNTDQCVLGTLVDAYNAGWDCILVEDCCGTTTPSGREVCTYNIAVSQFDVSSYGLWYSRVSALLSPPMAYLILGFCSSHGLFDLLLNQISRLVMGL